MTRLDASGLNAGYVGLLLEQYLDNPEAVDPAWREIFERDDEVVRAALPALDRLAGGRRDGGNGAPIAVAEPGAGAGAFAPRADCAGSTGRSGRGCQLGVSSA